VVVVAVVCETAWHKVKVGHCGWSEGCYRMLYIADVGVVDDEV